MAETKYPGQLVEMDGTVWLMPGPKRYLIVWSTEFQGRNYVVLAPQDWTSGCLLIRRLRHNRNGDSVVTPINNVNIANTIIQLFLHAYRQVPIQ